MSRRVYAIGRRRETMHSGRATPPRQVKHAHYKVMVDDNFHYMDEDERWELGTFATAEGALAACRKLIDAWLAHNYKLGMTAYELYEHYTSFGDEPFFFFPPTPPRKG